MNERIKQLRKQLGLTLEKFGERLGVSKVAISLIENGKNALTDQMLKSIRREFNVREEWLRTGEGDMFVQMSRDEEIISFIQSVQNDGNSFKKKFIKMLASLDDTDWAKLEKHLSYVFRREV